MDDGRASEGHGPVHRGRQLAGDAHRTGHEASAVGRLFPARFEDVPDADLDGPFQLVVAMDVPGLDLDRLRSLCSGLLVVTEAG